MKMDDLLHAGVLQEVRSRFREIVEREGLLQAEISVSAKTLTTEEAIGCPTRTDYPIVVGKELMIEATVLGARGQAFTDSPRAFAGPLSKVLDLDLTSNRNRAVFIASLNAFLGYRKQVHGTVHCKDEDPEACAQEIATAILQRYGKIVVGLIGLNPAVAERLIETFGADRVRITDLNRDNIGRRRFGVEIWDGSTQTEDLIEAADMILLTGTALVNGTFDAIAHRIRDRGKDWLVYGVTAAGACELLDIDRICPRGRDG